MKKTLIASLLLGGCFLGSVQAADYVVDTKGAHASINFKIKHLGYSWLTGRFNKFDGKFSYDVANISGAKVNINIDTSSIDTNHAARNKHIRSDDFLDVSKFATATFSSTKVEDKGHGKLAITGDLTLHGVTKSVVIDAVTIGEGKDPWGGYRAGFTGITSITMKDFGIDSNFGEVLFELNLEGIRK